jgi:hypothetical protein
MSFIGYANCRKYNGTDYSKVATTADQRFTPGNASSICFSKPNINPYENSTTLIQTEKNEIYNFKINNTYLAELSNTNE